MGWYKKAQQIISLTPTEMEWVRWALDVMEDYWCTEDGSWERGGDLCDRLELPVLEGNKLVLSDNLEVIEDLLYRLEDQAMDISKTDAISEKQISARNRGALSAAEKIRNSLRM